MKQDVLITINGLYRFEGQEDDEIELFTQGTFQKKDDAFIITYTESDDTGYDGCETTLHIEGSERVTMTRRGLAETHLVVQRGLRHQGIYDLGFGEMMIGISGINIKTNLHETGGEVMFHYALDVNSEVASENKMTITVKEREPNVHQ